MDSAAEARGLMAGAMIGLDEEGLSDPPTGRLAIVGLHRLGSREVLEEALAACRDADPLRRQVGAAVLGQLGHHGIGFTPVFVDERYRALADLLAAERDGAADSDVIAETCFALGHLRDPRATPALAALRGHPETRVRFAVAFALGGWSTPEAVAALNGLAEDPEETVRDWATFGLAVRREVE